MPKAKKREVKDSARKRTLNLPTSKQVPPIEERDVLARPTERQIGQYTGAGTPPLQKK